MTHPSTPRAAIDAVALEAALRLSGITHNEFAELIEASRTTVFLWRTAARAPHRRTAARCDRAIRALTRAAEAGKLPLLDDEGSAPRDATLRRICRDYGL